MTKILYLEDEMWQVENTIITFMRKELGLTVDLVTTTDEAIKELSTNVYDAVFLDVMLDLTSGSIKYNNSGLLIAKLILDGEFIDSGNPTNIPIIIASGVWDTTVTDQNGSEFTVEDRARSLGIPYSYFLRKPFLVDEVKTILQKALS